MLTPTFGPVKWAARARPVSAGEERLGRRFVGDQAVDETSLERGEDRRDFPGAERHRDGEHRRRSRVRNAGDAQIGAPLDEAAAGIEGPAGHLAHRTEAHELEQLLAADEAVD